MEVQLPYGLTCIIYNSCVGACYCM